MFVTTFSLLLKNINGLMAAFPSSIENFCWNEICYYLGGRFI